MSSEVVPELLPVDSFQFLMGFNTSIPPIYNGSNQLMCCKQNPLSVGALNLATSSQLFSTNRRHPLARWSERMSEAWSTKILQACHVAEVVALVVVLELAAYSP
jgi:hypothetical protein